MLVIHKHRLVQNAVNTVSLPGHCRILSAGEQYGDLVMWVLNDPSREHYLYKIAVVGTGISGMIEETDRVDWQFIQTVQMSYGLVWHVFVKIDFDEMTRMDEVVT